MTGPSSRRPGGPHRVADAGPAFDGRHSHRRGRADRSVPVAASASCRSRPTEHGSCGVRAWRRSRSLPSCWSPPVVAAAIGGPLRRLFDGFYRSGALVFGGGCRAAAAPGDGRRSGGLGNDEFLAGYGAAQAVPGPLFTFAAYLGTRVPGPLHGWSPASSSCCDLPSCFPAGLWYLALFRTSSGVDRLPAGDDRDQRCRRRDPVVGARPPFGPARSRPRSMSVSPPSHWRCW